MMKALTARDEWRANWPLVLAAMVGISFASVAAYSMTVFIQPLTEDFGWTRAQATFGLAIFALFAVPLSPVAGALLDRWGARRIAIPGMALSACALAAFSLANGSIVQWLGLWTVYAVVALAIKTTIWSAAISNTFVAGRGMALAVMLCGTALAQTFGPLIVQPLVDDYGWRDAYLWMGLGWGGLAFLLLVVFFRPKAGGSVEKSALFVRSSDGSPQNGLSFGHALRSRTLQRLALAIFLTTALGIAIVVHLVPILTAAGNSRSDAAQIAALAGIAGITGKLLTGWLYDRSDNQWIGAVSISLPSLSCVLLLDNIQSSSSTLLAMAFLGYGSGASLQAIVYLTSRYAGLAHFGKIFGSMASLMALGNGVGPPVAGWIFDTFHTYQPLLIGGLPVGLICAALVFGLGSYPDWDEHYEAA